MASKQKEKISSSPYIWTFTTYFAEGFPFTLIRSVSSVFFRDSGMSLQAIGLTSLFGLSWIIKFLWAPQVDSYATKRRWLIGTELILCVLLLAVAAISPLSWSIPAIAVLLFCASFVAATHDTAIDGYYLEALDTAGQAKFVGYRVMAYRIAMMTGSGVIVTTGATVSWSVAFWLAAFVMILLLGFHTFFLPECQKNGRPLSELAHQFVSRRFLLLASVSAGAILGVRYLFETPAFTNLFSTLPWLKKISLAGWVGLILLASLVLIGLGRHRIKNWIANQPDTYYASAFVSFMDRDKIGVVLAFIILIRTGEFMLSSMAAPFMVDLGIKAHYGWISGGVGLPCSIIGAMFGGALISKYGLKKMIWPFIGLQNCTNLMYMLLALSLENILKLNTGAATPVGIGTANLVAVAIVHAFDQFSGGLGTAVLMTYLMRLCHQKHKAAHYAIGTGLMSVSGLYAGILSGFLATWLGYGYFFAISFVFSIPGMLVIFVLPLFDSPSPSLPVASS